LRTLFLFHNNPQRLGITQTDRLVLLSPSRARGQAR
jgi:hypothetical protein